MKKSIVAILIAAMSMTSFSSFAQAEKDTALLGLPGDNLDLYAALDLFLKSKTIEGFEKSLNEQSSGINNLDLDLDKKVDFIKVVTKKKDDSYTFVLQVAVSKTETQDVAVILVDKDKDKKVKVQMVGDKELYGDNYIVEPTATSTPAVTANPAYVGPEPAKTAPATTAIVVETVPIVQYVYSPAYVPYVPPYYYGFYPPYFAAFSVMAVGIYRANHYYHHGGGYGYHNTVVINNHNHYNNYNNTETPQTGYSTTMRMETMVTGAPGQIALLLEDHLRQRDLQMAVLAQIAHLMEDHLRQRALQMVHQPDNQVVLPCQIMPPGAEVVPGVEAAVTEEVGVAEEVEVEVDQEAVVAAAEEDNQYGFLGEVVINVPK